MASGASTGGKILSGCSCLSIIFFVTLSLFVRFGLPFAYEALPDLYELWGLFATASIGFNACCCFSGVGFILGIILLLVGRNSEGAEV